MRPARALSFFSQFTLHLLLVLCPLAAGADTVSVQNVRMWQAPDHTRLVLDLSGPIEHRLFTLKDPTRVVIDMDNAHLIGALPSLDASNPIVAALRSGDRGDNTVRLVIDLKAEVQPRTFLLKPFGDYGHRLVVDLVDSKAAEEDARLDAQPAASAPPPANRDLVVAIDAGHGGDDPGAIGRRYRTREKDVVLAIARELEKLVAATPGMKPVMIRDGDYYVGLRERIRKADRKGADVFISIHADSIPGRYARGSSVYALSERGATNEAARVLADKENAADMIGGSNLNEKDDLLVKVLVDMTQNATIGDSLSLGADMLTTLRGVGPLHLSNVGQAGFVVLKSPHIPSVLVETAFISNPDEERKLRDRAAQRRIAQGIYDGLQRAVPRLLARRGTPGVAGQGVPADGARAYVVKSGDTLASIARQYEIDVDALRFLNDIRDNQLPVGTRLRLPLRGTGDS
jgi:N-acetylmuramoyl-L-alanine amidase